MLCVGLSLELKLTDTGCFRREDNYLALVRESDVVIDRYEYEKTSPATRRARYEFSDFFPLL